MFEQAFRNIDDVLRKEAGCTTELDYTEQSSWLLFLKYLDSLEEDKATEAALPETRRKLLDGLAEKGFGKEQLTEMQKIIDAEKSDLFDVLATWRDKADVVSGHALPCGHFIPEEAPNELLADLQAFLRG